MGKVVKIIKWVLITGVSVLIVTMIIMQHPSFGKLPSGKRLERIKKSPNFKDGTFHNLSPTPMLAEGVSYLEMIGKYVKGVPGREPSAEIAVTKTDLNTLPANKWQLVWFGHSSYYLVVDGLRILVDPMFSERASPFQFAGSKNYATTARYTTEDFPGLDAVLLTHDHYDHLDYTTIKKLTGKVNLFICPLGVGSHLEHWGINEKRIIELDWWESFSLAGLTVTAAPARHFSGRGFTRNKTLWSSYMLEAESHKLFVGGDSGYDSSFKIIRGKLGAPDVALLECGQYNEMWPYVHMMPEEVVQAAEDLGAKAFIPVHWARFTLALHPWNEPIKRVVSEAKRKGVNVITPRIGQAINPLETLNAAPWWEQEG